MNQVTDSRSTDLLILGTGALATLFAGHLSAAGHTVTMLGNWQAGLDALRAHGARLMDTEGNERAYPVHATNDPQECRNSKYALVLVKAWQTGRAARQLAECLAPDGVTLSLQNGLGNRETLARDLGPGRVALGVTTAGATLLGPGLVRPAGERNVSIERHPALGPMEEALRSTGFKVEIVEDARSLVWGKLVINAAINPLTALLRVPNGTLPERPAARALMGALAREAAQVAQAENIQLPFSDPVAAAEEVARHTAANHSSMFQDVSRGGPTEIDAICGAIAKHGAEHGIPTPVNQICWQLVSALEENSPRRH
jgi:2-dehydropantoate 2-reductase